ncbi:MAG: LysR family transcriptional regulator, partial [Muribaculaceae bacterium]|nr:LysR family transcriptional regulator [Muribaculaceae bacterium]
MELRQLRYFVKVAETLSFSEAAKALYITQGTLSQQIKQLEAELGTQLFIRTSRSVCLTETGSVMLPYARRTIADADGC